ncbi:hypothetical protein KAT24_02280 [Candidatus Pacearchaeota archaeon]|nr:hypothetical protein [Candidatus Pacearchaeota archaeon]
MPNPRFLKTAERWKNPSLPAERIIEETLTDTTSLNVSETKFKGLGKDYGLILESNEERRKSICTFDGKNVREIFSHRELEDIFYDSKEKKLYYCLEGVLVYEFPDKFINNLGSGGGSIGDFGKFKGKLVMALYQGDTIVDMQENIIFSCGHLSYPSFPIEFRGELYYQWHHDELTIASNRKIRAETAPKLSFLDRLYVGAIQEGVLYSYDGKRFRKICAYDLGCGITGVREKDRDVLYLGRRNGIIESIILQDPDTIKNREIILNSNFKAYSIYHAPLDFIKKLNK